MLYDISINYHERYDGSAIRMVSPDFRDRDRDRIPRPQGVGIDIGAYEWHTDDVLAVEPR